MNNIRIKIIGCTVLVLCFTRCSEPVVPEFDFKEGLIIVDAIVSTAEGSSYVTIKESMIEPNLDQYQNVFIQGAEVTFINKGTGESFDLVEDEDIYIPSNDFVASVGDTWELDITLKDGRNYKSLPETVLEPVVILDIKANYFPEFMFDISTDQIVPGHSIVVSFNDSPDNENYYYWNFRSFELRPYCGIVGLEPPAMPSYYTESCETDCWRIRYNDNIVIFNDEFINGSENIQLPVAEVPLYTKEDILVEVQQFSISKAAHNYYKILKDIVDNNGGINAPPPAALLGNMFNPNNNEEYVLGRFSAGSATTATIFLERRDVDEPEFAGWLPPIDNDPISFKPCVEGRYSTAIQPEDWPTN